MRTSVSFKINTYIFLSIFSTTLFTSIYFYRTLQKENNSHVNQILRTSTHAAKNILKIEEISQYQINSIQDKDFKTIWNKLVDIQRNFDLRYIYVLQINKEKQILFLYDTGDNPDVNSILNSDGSYSYKYAQWVDLKEQLVPAIDEAGGDTYFQVYNDAPKEVNIAIEKKELIFAKEYSDIWGTYSSAFLPIEYNGQIVGVIGADYEISYIKNMEKEILYVILFVLGFAVFLNIIIGILLRRIFISPIELLAKSTALIAQGNLNTEIQTSKSFTKDEVSDLIQNFQFMSLKLSENFSKIENYSKEITQLSKAKDEFLSNLSHELKTPLTIIYGYSEMLTMNESYPPDVKEYSKEIYSSAQKLTDYLNDLILVTDIESNIVLQKTDLDFQVLFMATLEILKPYREEKEIQLNMPLGKNYHFIGDSALMEKAVSAIIKNAIIYNLPKGQVTIDAQEIKVEDFRFLQITISDSGIGIEKALQEKVFEKFFRVDSSLSYEVSGVGLGLYIAKKIIELHNGKIKLTSELNQGSQITLQIPLT
ncbi:MAG: HAMP domain-containing histidine kinase [Leptospiraceae bacterium]|nr:HAMP domain-containing histidine kinase [Leptospiraceae bacterium]